MDEEQAQSTATEEKEPESPNSSLDIDEDESLGDYMRRLVKFNTDAKERVIKQKTDVINKYEATERDGNTKILELQNTIKSIEKSLITAKDNKRKWIAEVDYTLTKLDMVLAKRVVQATNKRMKC